MPAPIVHLALGGTISMRLVDGLAQPTLTAVELAELAGIRTIPCDLATVGGPQLTFGILAQTVAAIRAAETDGADAVLVTLGTDAIEEVGAFIAYAGPYSTNVVITGAMEPGGEPNSDGLQNLRDAAAIATQTDLSEPVVVFAGRVTLARAVVKISGLQLDAFASPTADSWGVRDVIAVNGLPSAQIAPTTLGAPGSLEVPDVPIVVSALSTGAAPPPLPETCAPALVFVSGGAGNLAPEASALAYHALERGSVVAIATRALDRQLSAGYGYPGGSGQLSQAGAVLATGMSPHRLRMFLLLALSQGLRGEALKAALAAHVG